MPIVPKTFFSSKGHADDRERLFCVDQDDTLWVLSVQFKKMNTQTGEPVYAIPLDWYWARVSLQTENEYADKMKHPAKKEPPLR